MATWVQNNEAVQYTSVVHVLEKRSQIKWSQICLPSSKYSWCSKSFNLETVSEKAGSIGSGGRLYYGYSLTILHADGIWICGVPFSYSFFSFNYTFHSQGRWLMNAKIKWHGQIISKRKLIYLIWNIPLSCRPNPGSCSCGMVNEKCSSVSILQKRNIPVLRIYG